MPVQQWARSLASRYGNLAAMRHDLDRTALLVIDVQAGLDDPLLGPRNNPDCEANVAALIGSWRAAGRPVVFVRHVSVRPDSPLRPGQPGYDFKPVVSGQPDLLVTKQVNSAFLRRRPRQAGERTR